MAGLLRPVRLDPRGRDLQTGRKVLRTQGAVMITRRTFITGSAAVGVVAGSSSAHAVGAAGAHDAASAPPLTNLAHLRWLMDSVPLQASSIHTTYEIASRPTSVAPWTYA